MRASGLTRASFSPRRAAACAAAVAAILLAAPLADRAGAQEPSPFQAPASNPLRGDGMWIWYVKRAHGGKLKRIIGKAKKRGIEVLLIKSGDAASVARGADCLIIDAEGHYEGRYAEASTYMATLREQIGPDFPLGLATFPYVDYHPAFPYSVFLGPGGAQYNLPQLYWKTIGHKVDDAFVHPSVFNRAYGRPILPLGQVYLNPKKRQIKRFRKLARAHGMEGVSWWSWQHAGKRQWKAVGGKVKPLRGYEPYRNFPFLQLGAKGDLVAWAQQLLVGGGYSTPITGYFESPTESAVYSFQADKGLTQTGNIDVPTWDLLLQNPPLPVR